MTILDKIKELFDHWFGTFPKINHVSAGEYAKVILPIIRRTMPSIIAHDICGVQPMTGPIESIATLRARYADSQKPTMEQIFENTKNQLEQKKDEDI